jgi:hypothetical protein
MNRAILFLLAAPAFAQQETSWQALFDGQSLKGWKETPFTGHGAVKVEEGCVVLGKGYMTGINLAGEFPKANYELRLEAQRAEGNDFFAGITFPVNDSHLTWINGGWGGKVAGLSSLDGNDASENETTIVRDFQRGRWYRLWLAVTTDRVRAWIDDELVIDVSVANREVALRPGESDLSKPLGIASYNTVSKLRKIEWRPLPK